MKDWFDTLQPRERIAVAFAALFVAFAIAYFAIWAPLAGAQSSLSSSVVTWERALADLRPLKVAVRDNTSGSSQRAGAGQSLVVIVDTTLSRFQLSSSLQRSQPTGQDGIRVEFESAAFDDLMLWLGDLSSTYGMQVQSGNFTTTSQDAAGRVNASLTLER